MTLRTQIEKRKKTFVRDKEKTMEWFLSMVKRKNGCWEWQGSRKERGYGQVWYKGKTRLVHRLYYKLFRGEIKEGMELDHLCKNTSCINPEHLEVVTHKVNTLRNTSFSAVNARKTICKRGHSLTDEKTSIDIKMQELASLARETK